MTTRLMAIERQIKVDGGRLRVNVVDMMGSEREREIRIKKKLKKRRKGVIDASLLVCLLDVTC